MWDCSLQRVYFISYFLSYLGQKPTDMTIEEWVKELDTLPCMICGQNTENDDELLMLCDLCNKGTKIN